VSNECDWQAWDGDVAYVGGCNPFSIGKGDYDWVDGNTFVFAVCAFHDKEGGSAGVRNGVRGVDHHGIGLMYAARLAANFDIFDVVKS
jgi:hypothetical protein